MIVLSQPVSGAYYGESLLRSSIFVLGRRIFLYHRIVVLLRGQRVCNRAFERLVVFPKRAIRHPAQWDEQAADAFRLHAERPHAALRPGGYFGITNVVAAPVFLRLLYPHVTRDR